MKTSIYILSLLFYFTGVLAQSPFTVQLSKTNQTCQKGAAGVQVSGGKLPYSINWSTGASNVSSISDLDAGDYSVTVKDSTSKDTVISFQIEKEVCPVIPSNHFTPNGDNYNDTWQIGNVNYYPDFELFVFNKWGQQVHHQKEKYIPWDGTWLGVTTADGTYYYVFYYKASDKGNFVKGDVSILR